MNTTDPTMKETFRRPLPIPTCFAGSVSVSYHDIVFKGGCCSDTESVILGIAATKGCPVDESVVPRFHPAYDYTISHGPAGKGVEIEWRLRSE